MDLTPNPPQAGQPLTIFGAAMASSGPAPAGNVTVYVSASPSSPLHIKPQNSLPGHWLLLRVLESTNAHTIFLKV